MKVVIFILLLMVVSLVSYLCAAFISLEINPLEWEVEWRFALVFVTAVSVPFCVLTASEWGDRP